jgi:hypothetical protein
MDAPYITVHYVPAMDARTFSIWRGNILNTPETIAKVRELFPEPDWWIEFHHAKIDLTWVVR